MACGACMTHTNPEPCCDHDSSFGSLAGLSLLDTENPPWIQTAIGAAVAFAGYRLREEESDLAVPLMLGGLLVPAAMWFKRAGREDAESSSSDDVAFNGVPMTRKGLIPAQDLGALALQSNPAHYGNPVASAVRSGSGFVPPHAGSGYITVPGFATMRTRRFPTNYRGMEAAERYILQLLEARGCPPRLQSALRGKDACLELYSLLRRVRYYLSRLSRSSISDIQEAFASGTAGYGSPDADDVKKGLAGAGAAGFGIMGALIGAGVGAGIQFRGKPLKDGWLYGAMAGFLLPVVLLAPKKDEAA